MVEQETPHPSTAQQVENFLNSNYRKSDLWRLGRIENRLIDDGPMPADCRAVVTIPAHYLENRVEHVIGQFEKQDALAKNIPFEVLFLVNGPDGTDFDKSPAFYDLVRVLKEGYDIHLGFSTVSYPKSGGFRIGRVRKDLGGLALKRAAASEVDLNKLVLITNDADSIIVPPDYISRIVSEFDRNPRLNGWTGLVDYPFVDFYADHLFLTIQRFSDIFDIVTRYRDKHMIMHAGSSAFRATAYMEAGGHTRSKTSENRSIYKHLVKDNPESVTYSHQSRLITNSRRGLTAINQGVPLAFRHHDFGGKEDIAWYYHKSTSEVKIPETANKITAEDFPQLLNREILAFYLHHLVSMATSLRRKGGDGDGELDFHGSDKPTEEHIARMYEFMSKKMPNELQNLQANLKTAAFFTGIDIDFVGRDVQLKSYARLYNYIMEKFNYYG